MEETSRIFSFLHHQEKKFWKEISPVQSKSATTIMHAWLLAPLPCDKATSTGKGKGKKDDNNLDFVRFVVSRKVHHPLLSLLGRRR